MIFSDVSHDNLINYAIIQNAYQGIAVYEPSNGTKLAINQTIINNAYDAGLIAENTSITAENVLISNCGKDIMLTNGGTYIFTHCTSVAYSNLFVQHKDPVLQLSNSSDLNTSNDLTASFRNCIFWGEDNGFVTDEVQLSNAGNSVFNINFDHVVWRVAQNPSIASCVGTVNADPMFDSVNTSQGYYNFRLKKNSPALNTGIPASVNIDLDGSKRNASNPSIGCYEY